MIIKHPENKDIPGLRRLWQQAFGDTDSLLDKFFRVGFGFDRCLCIRDGAQIVAALYWFDCSWGEKKVAYIYAVATDEGYRGQGLCRRLMDDAHRQLREQGYCGAALVPGEEGLIRLYEKFGYRSICPVQAATTSEIVGAEAVSPAEYARLRPSYLGENAILQGSTALAFLASYGAFYKTPEGICCGYNDGETFRFEEILGDIPAKADAFLEAMYLSLDGDHQLPAYFAIPLN